MPAANGLLETPDLTKTAQNPLTGDPIGSGTAPDVAQTKAFGYSPTTTAVNDSTDTVSAQLDRIINKGGPNMERAGAFGDQTSQARGLLNSSIGVEAAQGAMIDRALPIAQADANTYSTTRLTNQQAENQAGQFNAAAANSGGQFNAGEANKFGLIGSDTAAKTSLIAAEGAQTRQTQAQQITGQKDIQSMISSTQMTLADKQASLQKYLADQDTASRDRIAQLQSSTTLSAADKQAAVQKEIAQNENITRTTIANIQASTTLSAEDKRNASNQLIASNENIARQALQSGQITANALLAANEAALRTNLANIQESGATNRTQIQADAQAAIEKANNVARLSIAGTQAETTLAAANIEADYKTLMQTSASASDLYRSMMPGLLAISQDQNMDAASKQTAIDNQIKTLKSGMAMLGSLNGINLDSLLNAQ